ncbi:potassium transporter KefA [Candidatus Saccharibacteria bacterium]|nr:MAG: potassium transporter KefA [Candidatus Saccharibacteria bacterium]
MDFSEYYDALMALLDNVWIQIIIAILAATLAHSVLLTGVSRVVRRAVHRHSFVNSLEEKKRADTLISMFRTFILGLVWVVTIIVILSLLRVNLAALMTGAGVLGVVVGFGAQKTISDVLAGFFVIIENQYRVGDVVTLHTGGDVYSGTVEDITIRITRLRDLDGNLHTIPNGEVSATTNRSFEFANVNIDIGVAYESDIDVVERIINEVGAAMQQEEKWAESIHEPIHFLRVDGFKDSSVSIKALGQVAPAMQWDVAGEFRRRLKVAFEKGGISIPFPQVVIHRPKD